MTVNDRLIPEWPEILDEYPHVSFTFYGYTVSARWFTMFEGELIRGELMTSRFFLERWNAHSGYQVDADVEGWFQLHVEPGDLVYLATYADAVRARLPAYVVEAML